MGDIAFKQPRINVPQASPIAPNQKEFYKHELAHKNHVNPLKHDTTATFDEDEDQFFKKLRIRNDNPTPFFGTPILTHPSTIKIGEGLNAIDPKPIGNDPSKSKPFDEGNKPQFDFSDSSIDREVFGQIHALRESFEEHTKGLLYEIKILQTLQKDIHMNRDQYMKDLEERGADSETLSWLQWATTIGALGLAILCFSATVVTGGLSAILGGISAVAGMVDGGVRTTNTFHNMKTQTLQGVLGENKLLGELGHGQITDILARHQTTLQKMNNTINEGMQILKNRPAIIF